MRGFARLGRKIRNRPMLGKRALKKTGVPSPPKDARSADFAPFRHAADRVTKSWRKTQRAQDDGLFKKSLCAALRPMFVRASSSAPARAGLSWQRRAYRNLHIQKSGSMRTRRRADKTADWISTPIKRIRACIWLQPSSLALSLEEVARCQHLQFVE